MRTIEELKADENNQDLWPVDEVEFYSDYFINKAAMDFVKELIMDRLNKSYDEVGRAKYDKRFRRRGAKTEKNLQFNTSNHFSDDYLVIGDYESTRESIAKAYPEEEGYRRVLIPISALPDLNDLPKPSTVND